MIVTGVRPKSVAIHVEFSEVDLRLLKLALDNATFDLDLKNPEHVKASDFVTNGFYPIIQNVIKDLEEIGA